MDTNIETEVGFEFNIFITYKYLISYLREHYNILFNLVGIWNPLLFSHAEVRLQREAAKGGGEVSLWQGCAPSGPPLIWASALLGCGG
jgi:hypothetical protein